MFDNPEYWYAVATFTKTVVVGMLLENFLELFSCLSAMIVKYSALHNDVDNFHFCCTIIRNPMYLQERKIGKITTLWTKSSNHYVVTCMTK